MGITIYKSISECSCLRKVDSDLVEKAKWCEENNIKYEIHELWMASTAEHDAYIKIFDETDSMAFKLRWM